jgi:uncharacterized membrane-anchored protein
MVVGFIYIINGAAGEFLSKCVALGGSDRWLNEAFTSCVYLFVIVSVVKPATKKFV